jgi:hypothetical protein
MKGFYSVFDNVLERTSILNSSHIYEHWRIIRLLCLQCRRCNPVLRFIFAGHNSKFTVTSFPFYQLSDRLLVLHGRHIWMGYCEVFQVSLFIMLNVLGSDRLLYTEDSPLWNRWDFQGLDAPSWLVSPRQTLQHTWARTIACWTSWSWSLHVCTPLSTTFYQCLCPAVLLDQSTDFFWSATSLK